jgi:hypothetical protein
MNLKKYIDWLDSSIRFNSPMSKNSLKEIRDTLIIIQEDCNDVKEISNLDAEETANLFVKKRELFT